jgi:hypothetical protein
MQLEYMDLYDQIAKYYPIGISDMDENYTQYSGFKELQKLCEAKFNFSEYNKWNLVIEEIKNETQGVIRSSSDSLLNHPSYKGEFLLYSEQIGRIVYLRSINIQLCIFAPFYTVYGLDQIILKTDEGQDIGFQPLVYKSPIDIFSTWFQPIRNKVRQEYPDYKFVKFSLLSAKIPSLTVSSSHCLKGESSSIFQALFQFEDITQYLSKGDFQYE